jgi:hypothetical protein
MPRHYDPGSPYLTQVIPLATPEGGRRFAFPPYSYFEP